MGTEKAWIMIVEIHLNSANFQTRSNICICQHTSTILKELKFMKTNISCVTEEIINNYDVMKCANKNEFMYCEIAEAKDSLKQAGNIANKD